jgi:hypothetical protein
MLENIREGDTLFVPAQEKVTISLLASGARYDLTGPIQLQINTTKPLQPGPGLTQQAKPLEREGISATQNVDLSKFGGASSRDDAFPIYVDEATSTLDLDLLDRQFESSKLQVLYRIKDSQKSWVKADVSLIHAAKGRDQLRLASVEVPEDQYVMIYWGDKTSPDDNDAQFKVLRIPESRLKPLRALEAAPRDWPTEVGLFESYLHLRLFPKAEKLLDSWEKKSPTQADWAALRLRLNELRQTPPEPSKP